MANIIITGTSRGIGFEMAKLFADEGHSVLALSRNEQTIENLDHKNITAFSFDLSKASDFDRVEQFLVDDWKKVDILINNAGALLNKPFSETTLEEFKKVYEVNVFGVTAMNKLVIPFMTKSGHIVTVSSMGGVQGSAKFPGLSAYSSSKGGVITLTELLAEEYKETGPSFNVLALGAVQTEMLEEAFPGYQAPVTPLEMARYIKDFALNANKLFNGKLIQVSSSTP
ncbi:SDR family oxidoreductase [Maribacter sp. PR1]|uniref:SDR family oxidoreductase n=1 Tax=Maribacter cobaltidurans TaxID=1178778 RepID=A0ABU7IZ14_9FLAO|nr:MULTISPECIES: SDR family oxidoreductase [Maribacter]MDC6390681.1 SDR family oxidoreductase [Maribacter sp. PR1]MEE1978073.1 SDR family oxidoreductase [Maribacter cobaltidurans]